MRRISKVPRPSPALVVAIVALFAALGGTAVAISSKKVKKVVKQYATRVAHAEKAGALIGPPSGSTENALTAQIQAPRKGFLYVTAGSDVFGSGDFLTCAIAVDGTPDQFTRRSIDLAQDNEDNCATNGVEKVTRGTHTVSLQADARLASTVFDNSSLDVLWVPLSG